MCVASPNAAAARGDGTQAASDRKLSSNKQDIPDLRSQSIHFRPLVWTADGRPHPAVARTLQSAKSLEHRWKREIQIALLRRRAANDAGSPIDRMAPCWFARQSSQSLGSCPSSHPLSLSTLDGGDDDGADTRTDTAIPDERETMTLNLGLCR